MFVKISTNMQPRVRFTDAPCYKLKKSSLSHFPSQEVEVLTDIQHGDHSLTASKGEEVFTFVAPTISKTPTGDVWKGKKKRVKRKVKKEGEEVLTFVPPILPQSPLGAEHPQTLGAKHEEPEDPLTLLRREAQEYLETGRFELLEEVEKEIEKQEANKKRREEYQKRQEYIGMTPYAYRKAKEELELLVAGNREEDRQAILELQDRVAGYEIKALEWQNQSQIKKGRKEKPSIDNLEEICCQEAKDIILRIFARDKIRNDPRLANAFAPSVVIDYRSAKYYYVRVECGSDGYLCPHCNKWRVGAPFYLRGELSYDTCRDEQDPRILTATNIRWKWLFTCSTDAFVNYTGNVVKKKQEKEEAKRLMEQDGELPPKGHRYLKARAENASGVIKLKKNMKAKQNKDEEDLRKEVRSTWVPVDEDMLGAWTITERQFRGLRKDIKEDIDEDFVIERAERLPPAKKCQLLESWSSVLTRAELKEMLIAKILEENASSTIEAGSDELIAEGLTELFGEGRHSHVFYDLCYSSLTGEPSTHRFAVLSPPSVQPSRGPYSKRRNVRRYHHHTSGRRRRHRT
jgi:hypothetical protein